LPVVQAAMNHHHSPALDMVVMLALLVVDLSVLVDHPSNQHHPALKYNNTLLMPKASL
jgi:hypothetical protein